MKHISLFWPALYKQEWLKELGQVFSTRWIGQGPQVDKFEQKFGQKYNFQYPLAVNSGTAALELAYHLIGIGKYDEVLTPVFTCTATNIPLARRGAKLKFIDVNQDLTCDYEDIVRKISAKTKAIVVATIGGLPIDKRIFTLAKKQRIPVVVDAAQSVGMPEPQGDYVGYSFQAIKHFTSGDGGMLVVRSRREYQRAKKLRWFGIDREAKKRVNWKWTVNHQMAMDIEELGYKYHMNDVAAAMGLVGLKHADDILRYRKKLCELYDKVLPDHTLVYGGACWLMAILTDKRDELMDKLQQGGIESDLVQIRNDIFKVFGGKRQNLPNMDRLEDKYLYLPLHPKITLKDVEYIAKVINKFDSTK